MEWALPLRADVGLPICDVVDTGLYVLAVLADPQRCQNRRLLMATEYLTMAQIAATYQRMTGERAGSRVVPLNPQHPRALQTSYNDVGYYAGEAIEHLPE